MCLLSLQTGATKDTTFLRGIQVTDKEGDVTFDTIYPGWYPSRCIHIHIEVYVSGSLKHVGQLFFDESLTESSRSAQPYSSRTDKPLPHDKDSIYKREGGVETTFGNVQGDASTGFVASMYIGIDPDATVKRVQ